MLKTYKPLVILAIIGFIALPSGTALKCYQCTPTDKDDCALLKDDMSKECSAATNPTEPPVTENTTPTMATGKTTPTIVAEKTTPTIVAEKTTPTIVAEKTTPTIVAETTTPTIVAEKTTPTIVAEKTTPTIVAEKTTPTIVAEKNTPTIVAEKTTPTIVAEKTTPTIVAEAITADTNTPQSKDANTEKNLEDGAGKLRKRRNLINRFSRVQLFDGSNKPFCYTKTVTVDNKTRTERGCGDGKQADYCQGKDGCKTCDSDNCNSATSNIVYTSMIMSLVIVVLFTK